MTWNHMLRTVEGLEEALESRERESLNTAHFARLQLAEALARAREILEALANDDMPGDIVRGR